MKTDFLNNLNYNSKNRPHKTRLYNKNTYKLLEFLKKKHNYGMGYYLKKEPF